MGKVKQSAFLVVFPSIIPSNPLLAMKINMNHNSILDEILGENHLSPASKSLLRPDVFALSGKEKIKIISEKFREIMVTLGLDLTDDSLNGTPERVAKMYVNELFSGLDPGNKPEATLFDNNYQYNQMIVEKNITLYSTCEHHFVPIIGKAQVAYISSGKVIGLSKLNRIVHYFSKRPQVQERMTMQIAEELKSILKTDDVAIVIEADHLCVQSRGIRDTNSSTITSYYSGKFNSETTRAEFLNYIR